MLARSVFEHLVNYRSAMIYGLPQVVTDPAEKLAGLRCLTEHIAPGQWDYARQPSRKELAATWLLALPLTEASVKSAPARPTTATARTPRWACGRPSCLWPPPGSSRSPAPALSPGIPVPGHIRARAGTGPTGRPPASLSARTARSARCWHEPAIASAPNTCNPEDECRPCADPGRPPSRQGDFPMMTAVSADGTAIAFDRYGDGPPVITTVGAFNTRSVTEPLARALAERFAVLNYDRRGRGDSGDTAPYAVDREIEDLGALVAAAGGSASVFGYSSGAALALKAAANGLPITKLVLYEPPFNPDDSYPLLPADLAGQLAELVSVGRRGDAVELYQTQAVGIPKDVVAQMRHAPFRPGLEAIAHTLAYDATIVGDRSLPTELIASIMTPALVISGEQSPPFLRAAARAVAQALPNGRLSTLPGQSHDISPQATAPVMAEFLAS
ncbi:MAG: alpha/beta fold hydrolase [Micromonosporaceae bacterium]